MRTKSEQHNRVSILGGRGKGAFIGNGMSGVNFCASSGELADITSKMIGMIQSFH